MKSEFYNQVGRTERRSGEKSLAWIQLGLKRVIIIIPTDQLFIMSVMYGVVQFFDDPCRHLIITSFLSRTISVIDYLSDDIDVERSDQLEHEINTHRNYAPLIGGFKKKIQTIYSSWLENFTKFIYICGVKPKKKALIYI